MTEPEKRARWKAGESGNPRGRTPGAGEVANLRATIAGHVPEITGQLLEAAKDGAVQAARLLLERVLPPKKPTELSVPLALTNGSLTEQGRAVLAAVISGDLAPEQAARLLLTIGALARVAEIDELSDRIERLVGHHNPYRCTGSQKPTASALWCLRIRGVPRNPFAAGAGSSRRSARRTVCGLAQAATR